MSSYRLRYLLTAPLIVVAGLTAVFWGRRAAAFGSNVRHWADSLDRGSGPVRIVLPLPVYIGGDRVGNLDTVVIERHQRHSVDSLRIVVKPLASAGAAELPSCAVRIESFDRLDPGEYNRALVCASDTSGLTRFGTVSFGGSRTAALYVDASDAACMAPGEDVNVAVNTGSVDVAVQAPGASVAVRTGPVHVSVNKHGACGRHLTMTSADIQRMVRDAQAQSRSSAAAAREAARVAREAAQAARAAGAAAR